MKNLFQLMLLLILITGTAMSQDTAKAVAAPTPPEVYTYVEQMPTYPGGDEAMQKYISTNLIYPKQALKDGIEGRVYLKFIVNEDGSVTDVMVVRGLDKNCDAEAVRVVKAMPNWKPGKQNGKNVAVYFTLPIQFRLVNATPAPIKK